MYGEQTGLSRPTYVKLKHMDTLILNAKSREATGNQVGALRREGFVPAIVYGTGVENMNVSIELRELSKVHSQVGESALVDLVVDENKPVKVLIQAVQYNPVRHEIIHADLRAVKMDEKIDASIELELVGESPAVKAHGAILVRNMDMIDVRCLPTDLVQSLEVDLGMLKETGDTITVSDLVAPSGIEFLAEPDELIVVANEPAAEEVDAVAEGDVEAVEVAAKGKEADKKEGAGE